MAYSSHENQIGSGRGRSVQREKSITERKEIKGKERRKERKEKRERKENGKSSHRIWDCTTRGKEPLILWLTSFLRAVLRPDLRPCVDCAMGILYAR